MSNRKMISRSNSYATVIGFASRRARVQTWPALTESSNLFRNTDLTREVLGRGTCEGSEDWKNKTRLTFNCNSLWREEQQHEPKSPKHGGSRANPAGGSGAAHGAVASPARAAGATLTAEDVAGAPRRRGNRGTAGAGSVARVTRLKNAGTVSGIICLSTAQT